MNTFKMKTILLDIISTEDALRLHNFVPPYINRKQTILIVHIQCIYCFLQSHIDLRPKDGC